MHYLYLVATKKDKDTKEDEIQSGVYSQLESEGFAGDGGFFSGAKSDWFVMGGRWSGHLQEIQLDDWHKKAGELVKKGKKKEDHDFISTADIENNKEELQKLWISLGGKGQNSWDRDKYKNNGFNDDTMLLDEKLYKALKKKGYEDTEVAIMEDGYIQDEMLLSIFLEDKEVVNNYYLSVVDYHN